jgi:hypothetical protein
MPVWAGSYFWLHTSFTATVAWISPDVVSCILLPTHKQLILPDICVIVNNVLAMVVLLRMQMLAVSLRSYSGMLSFIQQNAHCVLFFIHIRCLVYLIHLCYLGRADGFPDRRALGSCTGRDFGRPGRTARTVHTDRCCCPIGRPVRPNQAT